ncbi:hypothetical protein A3F07_01170 [candidate division WWE3 bacterium RIFCSPHIGHO2_12_FULL_38_15]|nr:MAG: hypothetical protein A3F07_01170 [candidate division WWE3 bacterium RIFCSPHIGHO2_12_FULL_38_15]OGC54254.1 MAG: hypothetical protein A3B64_01970 [candidate division WWE3 bacterium RIFCSPLOWO2_01_FULL_37_24]
MINPFSSRVTNPKSSRYDGEDQDEQILYVLRKAFITNYKWILTTVFFALFPFLLNYFFLSLNGRTPDFIPARLIFIVNIFWYLFLFGFVFANYINWYFNIYLITNKKIIDMDFVGILYKNISEAPLSNIEDVTSNISGAFGTIFNIGHVLIQTAGEKTEFEFYNVSNPSKVRDILSDFVMEERKRHGHQ